MKFHKDNLPFRQYNRILLAFVVAVLISLAVLLITVYAPGISHNNVKKIYYADNISRAHQIVIDRFNEKYKDKIEVVPIDLPFIKFNTNLRKELLARSLRNRNTLIDVFAIDQVWNARFAKWAEPLTSYFPAKTIETILPKVLANSYSNNSIVSIPLHVDVGVMYYRRDLVRNLDKTGDLESILKNSITWDDFFQLNRRFNKPHNFYSFQGYNYEGLIVNFMEILGPEESNAIFDMDSLKINLQLAKKGTAFIQDLIEKRKLAPLEVTTFNEDRCYEHALKNNIPFFRGWPSFYKTLENRHEKKLIGIAAIPHFKDQPSSSVLGGWNLMISKHSKAKKEAAVFIEYMISPETQKIMLKEGGFLPVVEALYSDPDILQEMTYLSYLKQLVDNGFYRPNAPQYTQLSKILADHIHNVLANETSLEDAFNKPIIINRY